MNHFQDAIAKHVEWKLKLKQHIAEEVVLDTTEIGNTQACKLGQWIYGEGLIYNGSPNYEALCYHHDHFHRAAAAIGYCSNRGDKGKAFSLMKDDGDFMKSSHKLVWAISQLSKEFTHQSFTGTRNVGDIRYILKQKEGNKLHSIDSGASVGDAIKFMGLHDIGYLVVYEEKKFLGIFSGRWFVKNLALQGLSSLDSSVSAFLDTETFSLDPGASVEQYISLMITTQKWHLAVM